MLAIAAMAGIFAFSAANPLDLDISYRGASGGRALLRFGFASVELAFDFGQACSKSNSCAGLRL